MSLGGQQDGTVLGAGIEAFLQKRGKNSPTKFGGHGIQRAGIRGFTKTGERKGA